MNGKPWRRHHAELHLMPICSWVASSHVSHAITVTPCLVWKCLFSPTFKGFRSRPGKRWSPDAIKCGMVIGGLCIILKPVEHFLLSCTISPVENAKDCNSIRECANRCPLWVVWALPNLVEDTEEHVSFTFLIFLSTAEWLCCLMRTLSTLRQKWQFYCPLEKIG